jgi:hypothetical protein
MGTECDAATVVHGELRVFGLHEAWHSQKIRVAGVEPGHGYLQCS